MAANWQLPVSEESFKSAALITATYLVWHRCGGGATILLLLSEWTAEWQVPRACVGERGAARRARCTQRTLRVAAAACISCVPRTMHDLRQHHYPSSNRPLPRQPGDGHPGLLPLRGECQSLRARVKLCGAGDAALFNCASQRPHPLRSLCHHSPSP